MFKRKHSEKGNLMMSGIFRSIASIIVVALLLIGGFWLIAAVGRDAIDRFLNIEPARATVNLTDTITSTLTANSQLVTAEEVMRKVRTRVNVQRGLLNAGGYGATYEADVVVRYGYNLLRDEFKVESMGQNAVRITLPKAELLSCSMTPVDERDRSTALFPDWAATRELGEYMLMNLAVENAISNQDNFTIARNNARETIRRIVTGIAPDIMIEFNFLDAEQTRVDSTCRPPTPMRWRYDERRGWILG
jgi:hypothetical protein